MTWSRDDKLEIYAALIAAVPNLDLKGKTVRYTSMNGNMFSFLSEDGELAFRLGSVTGKPSSSAIPVSSSSSTAAW